MKSSIALLLLMAVLSHISIILAANWDLNFNMVGFTKRSTLLVTNCTTNIKQQIFLALAGNKDYNCIEEPTKNQNKPHVSCVSDSSMGKVINFTLYKTDDDSATDHKDRQRIEMKVYGRSPENLKARKNSHFVYAYWSK